jgi:hypothetical protein
MDQQTARAVALPGQLQMIKGNGRFSSETSNFVTMKKYSVISIIGPQCSGN